MSPGAWAFLSASERKLVGLRDELDRAASKTLMDSSTLALRVAIRDLEARALVMRSNDTGPPTPQVAQLVREVVALESKIHRALGITAHH